MDVCYHPVWVPMPSHFSKVVFARDGRGAVPWGLSHSLTWVFFDSLERAESAIEKHKP